MDAALDVLAQSGYSQASVQDIVTRSGTSKGSFYFHFPSKETMVEALLNQMSDKLIKKIQRSIEQQPTPLHRVAAGIDMLMATFSRQRKVAQVLLLNIMGHGQSTDRKFLPIRDRFAELIKRELDTAVSQGQIAPVDTALVARIWLGALQEVIVGWLLTGQPNPLASATPILRTTLLRSIGADTDLYPELFLEGDSK
ncbi:TetR/AcrR family transcriptional regulator [Chloroflexota bacterium]